MCKVLALLLTFTVVMSLDAVAATGDDDGFIWVDANTKIRIKPIGKSAAGGATRAPQPQKEEKQEQDEKQDPKKEEPRK